MCVCVCLCPLVCLLSLHYKNPLIWPAPFQSVDSPRAAGDKRDVTVALALDHIKNRLNKEPYSSHSPVTTSTSLTLSISLSPPSLLLSFPLPLPHSLFLSSLLPSPLSLPLSFFLSPLPFSLSIISGSRVSRSVLMVPGVCVCGGVWRGVEVV